MTSDLSRFPPKRLSASAVNNAKKFYSPLEKVAGIIEDPGADVIPISGADRVWALRDMRTKSTLFFSSFDDLKAYINSNPEA